MPVSKTRQRQYAFASTRATISPDSQGDATMPRTRRAHTVGVWSQLTRSIAPELLEALPMLKILSPKLMKLEADVDRLVTERDRHQARKQETTRKLQNALEEGRKVAQVIRVGLRHHLGAGN